VFVVMRAPFSAIAPAPRPEQPRQAARTPN
jgi:hypothetical protein